MKLAFIHFTRTGGTYAVNLLAQGGAFFHCPWRLGLNRDWTRAELFQRGREASGVIHSHAVAWDLETVRWCTSRGWTTFAIARDPRDQLVSLWHFCDSPADLPLDEFMLDQIDGKENLRLDFHHWALPEWWREIDVVVPYGPDLHEQLERRLKLTARPPLPHENARPRIADASPSVLDLVARSVFYERYLEAIECASNQNLSVTE